jgi:hypothetical protein
MLPYIGTEMSMNYSLQKFFSLSKLIRFVLKQVAKCEECKYDFINVDNEFDRED